MKKYILTLAHDNGKVKIKSGGSSLPAVIQKICKAENCPESAIMKICDEDGKVLFDRNCGKSYIMRMKEAGATSQAIYQDAAAKLGLWGVAFYGHKGRPGDRAKLTRLWNRIVSANHQNA